MTKSHEVMSMKLYQYDGCPYCEMVKDRLDELGLRYEKIDVPIPRFQRQEVFKVSGQWLVPVMVVDGQVLDDEDKILDYLDRHYDARGNRRSA